MKKPGIFGGVDNCPVLVWNDYIYYAFSCDDNIGTLCIVAYGDNGIVAKEWEQTGLKDVCEITVDDINQTVAFWGQANHKVEMNWEDLLISAS